MRIITPQYWENLEWLNSNVEFNDLIGKTLSKIEVDKHDNKIYFYYKMFGKHECFYIMHHNQDCCESVVIEDIIGDLDDLIGSPILMAEEATSNNLQEWEKENDYRESFTWTFYRLATIKGYVTIRWYGSSNGYYSESVNLSHSYKEIK